MEGCKQGYRNGRVREAFQEPIRGVEVRELWRMEGERGRKGKKGRKEIKRVISNLKDGKAAGIDKMPNEI